MIEADKLGQLRTGAASGVAAKFLARSGATTLGVLGCGWQAESQVQCIREAVPTIEHVVVYCRTEKRLEEFCKRIGAEEGETHRDAGGQDVVVTRPLRATRSSAANGFAKARSSARSGRTTAVARATTSSSSRLRSSAATRGSSRGWSRAT